MPRWRASALYAFLFLSSIAAQTAALGEDNASKDASPPLTTMIYQVADLVLPLSPGTYSNTGPDFESLLDLIELRTGTECWAEGGGAGTITTQESTMSLVVRQTQDMHERIASLMQEVRGTGDLAIRVDMQFLKGNLEACEAGMPNRSARGLVDQSGKQRLMALVQSQKDGQVLAAPKVTFFNGQSASVSTGADQITAVDVRGVISKDNRYARLWIDTKVGNLDSRAEVLIPEGHTAVQKLPGENSWLLVTSHVINAEEPQIIVPRQAPPAPAEPRRFLVPVDDTPEPAEITHIPEFKAQAELFGITVKLAAAIEATDHAGETAAVASFDQPTLVQAVERVAYQVAQIEPTESRPAEAPAVTNVDLEDFNLVPAGSCDWPTCNMQLLRGVRTKSPVAAHRIHGFAHGSSVDQPVEPAAHIDVCLDDAGCPSAQVTGFVIHADQASSGPLIDRVFAQTTPPDLPLPPSSVATGRPSVYSRTNSRHLSALPHDVPSLEIEKVDQVYGRGFPSVLVYAQPSHWREFGRNTQRFEPQPHPKTIAKPRGFDLIWSNPAASDFTKSNSRVQQASAEEQPSSIDEHLSAAAKELDELGLDAEAKTVRELLQSLSSKAQHRCEQIDAEISRLKDERARLEALSPVPSGARLHLLGTGP